MLIPVIYGNTGCGAFKGGGGGIKFLQKNQYTQRKLLKFEFWINGELTSHSAYVATDTESNGAKIDGF